jgi:hypothetical protein
MVMSAVLVSAFSLSGGCGKKAPPFVPKAKGGFALQVEKLQAGKQGGDVLFTGEVVGPGGQRGKPTAIESCRVYHVRYPLESPPCEGCPISFTTWEEVKAHVSGNGQFSCATEVKQPGIHYFVLRLIGPGGAVGPPSNRVKLLVK